MDFNGVIHPICAKHIKENESVSEDIIISELYQKVLDDINRLQPKTVYICVDGVVPLAKMMQQRKRRYLTVLRNKLDNVQVKWDTNAITPGTSFMQKLNTYFKKQLRYSTSNTKMVFSGSDEYGEGEHKIFRMLQTTDDTQNIIINGLDADLIILSLISHKKNIYLMREMPEQNNTYLSIDNLRAAIIKELSHRFSPDCDHKDLIETYCVMCSLLGNDFIPHLLTLNLKSNGLEKLLGHTSTSYKTFGLLVHNSEINYDCLSDILQNIANSEQGDIYIETSKYLRNQAQSGTVPSEYYALKNKDKIASAIYSNISNWRKIYYKAFFNTNISVDSSVISSACQEYIKGVYWTYAYYKKRDHNVLWYYPYAYPPSIRDIANYMLGNQDVPKDNDILKQQDVLNTKLQLLIVLPIESKHLLEDKYQKYMENVSEGLCHLYPRSYKVHTFLKTHLWECHPELPTANIDFIKQIAKI